MAARYFRSLVVSLLVIIASAPRDAVAQGLRSGQPPSSLTLDAVGDERLQRLERWLKAVAHHLPGEDDDALKEVAGWPNADLKDLWIDANVLTQLIRSAAAAGFTVRPEGQKGGTQIRYTKTDLHRLRVLACAAGGALVERHCMAIDAGSEVDAALRQIAALARAARERGDVNYVQRRGAILHSDVAMLAPLTMKASGDVQPPGALQRLRMEISDGQEVDLHQSAVHWEIARMLLDYVVPRGKDHADPGHDDMVREWYRATASWMQLREDHDKLHLDRARLLFPSDPGILFLSACQRETYAGPPIQTAVRSAVLPAGVNLDVGSDRAELRSAEALFRRLLDIKPGYAEARMRFGRVLSGLGKQSEAAVELRRAVADLDDPQLLYYANLFLGGAEEALGNRDAARVAYEQAAERFPMAQSPLVALSQLAWRYGDRGAALRAIDRLFALAEDDRTEFDDPWWSYFIAQARDADDLIEVMHRPFLSERLP